MKSLPLAGPAAIADTLLLQRSTWVLVVVRQPEIQESLEHIKAELELLRTEEQDGVGAVRVIEATALRSNLMAALGRYSEDDIVLLTGIEHLSRGELERLDLFRNR